MPEAGNGVAACIGAGRMGQGIAHCLAYSGFEVRLLDAKPRNPEAFERFRAGCLAAVRGSLAMLAELGAFAPAAVEPILDRVRVYGAAEAAAALAGARYVFEGVPEQREAKAAAFALFDRYAEPGAILASTTSTFLSTMLAELTQRPGRFLNAHWLNPAYLVPLVELSPSPRTEPEAVEELRRMLESVGKVPVVCKASPGYIVPRIQALAMNEAARLAEEGVAAPADIDKAIVYGFGLRFAVLGLLEFIDWGGGDILYYASRYLESALDDPRYRAPEVIERNMGEQRIGLKSGAGFYDYAGRDLDAYLKERLGAFLGLLRSKGLFRPPALGDTPQPERRDYHPRETRE